MADTYPISTDDVRLFMRDYASNNILLDDVQFTTDEIQRALSFAVDEWNVLAPITNDTPDVIPKSVLMLGTCAWLMQSESFLQIRNQATYQDGDVQNIGVDDKHQIYVQFALRLKEEWKTTAQRYKMQKNAEAAYGGQGSGYRWAGRYTR